MQVPWRASDIIDHASDFSQPDAFFMSTEPTQQRARGPLFHAMITDPRGDQLLPLAMLRERYPDLHARHVAKYAGREHRLRERVIPLECTWADVVFLSPLNPTVLFDAVRSAGLRMRDVPLWTLDASQLDPARCCIRLMRVTPGARTADPGTEDDYLPLTTATLRAVSEGGPSFGHGVADGRDSTHRQWPRWLVSSRKTWDPLVIRNRSSIASIPMTA